MSLPLPNKPSTPGGSSGGGSSSVSVSNFPATQPVSGTVAVSNFPAAGLTNSQLRGAPVDVADGGASLTVDGTVAVSNFPATQPVSGTVAVSNPGLTDAELRASPVPVSGTVTVANPGLTDAQLRASEVPVIASGANAVRLWHYQAASISNAAGPAVLYGDSGAMDARRYKYLLVACVVGSTSNIQTSVLNLYGQALFDSTSGYPATALPVIVSNFQTVSSANSYRASIIWGLLPQVNPSGGRAVFSGVAPYWRSYLEWTSANPAHNVVNVTMSVWGFY
jgi:hypothetical protein